jgi:hypothetical protein
VQNLPIESCKQATKVAKALKKSGSIALFWNLSTQPDRAVFYRLDRVHQTYAMPRLKIAAQQRQIQERELLQSGCFTDLVIKEYDRSIRYSTEQYLNFLKTQSDYSILPPDNQQNFADAIAEILNADGGWIDKPYRTHLRSSGGGGLVLLADDCVRRGFLT